MRDSGTRRTTVRRTIGRTWTLAVGFGFALGVAACSSDATSPGDPAAPTPIGAYSITTVNGRALPVAMFNEGSYLNEITGGTISLASDGKYIVVTVFRETVPKNVSTYRDSTFGTWTQTGAQINLKNAQDTTANSQGMWVDKQLTFALTDGSTTTTYVYNKK